MLEGISSDILNAPTSIMDHNALNGDALAHFGIKGQKWGVRRYQNPDGSLTEAGRKRYNSNGEYDSYRGGTWKVAKDFPNDPKKQASVLKQIADSRKKDAYDRLAKASEQGDLNKDVDDLIKNGTVKNKSDALKYLTDTAKKYNEEIDDDVSMFQSLGTELDLYQKGYLDKNTFDKLYDAEAARSVADYGRNVYTSPAYAESAKEMHDYKSKLNNRLSYWFGDNPSNPEFNPKKPISVTNDDYEELAELRELEQLDHSDPTQDFLAHHGIKGQKWGNRRYQNSDGSLTPLGRLRYGVGAARNATGKAAKAAGKAIGKAARKATGMQTDEELDAELRKAQAKYDRAEKKQLIDALTGKRKPLRKMSDRELNDYVNRLYQEKQAQALKKEIKENGRGFISKLAHNTMDNIAENTAKGIGEGVKRGISNALATKFEEAEKRKQAKKWDKYDEKHNADKVDAAKNRDKLSAARDKLELRALNGDADAAAILNTVAKSSRGNADKHSNTSATKDAVENARNSLELRAINGDKEALKTLRKVTDAKKGSKNGGKRGGDQGSGDQGSNGKKKPNNSTDKPSGQNDKKQTTAQSTSNTSGKKGKKSSQQSTDSSESKKSAIAGTKAYEEAKRKAKESIKKKASTPVSEARAYSVSNDTIDWMAELSSRKALPPAKK